MNYQEILDFWFNELTHEERFNGGEKVDTLVRNRFSKDHKAATQNEFFEWRKTAEGSLAEIILLDQFSRNIYRGQSEAFAFDGQALALAQEAIAKGFDNALNPDQRLFLYLPFMHSESRIIHEVALGLFEALGNQDSLQFERIHKEIIDRFGRYPHRNKQLGRESTQEEIEYLANESHSFFKS